MSYIRRLQVFTGLEKAAISPARREENGCNLGMHVSHRSAKEAMLLAKHGPFFNGCKKAILRNMIDLAIYSLF